MLTVEQVNRARRAYDVGFGGAQIRRLRLHPMERSGIDREISYDLKGIWNPLTVTVEKECICDITGGTN